VGKVFDGEKIFSKEELEHQALLNRERDEGYNEGFNDGQKNEASNSMIQTKNIKADNISLRDNNQALAQALAGVMGTCEGMAEVLMLDNPKMKSLIDNKAFKRGEAALAAHKELTHESDT